MRYCPKCHSEYADAVLECIDCHVKLVDRPVPRHVDLDLQDLVVPVGSFLCLIVAAGLLVLYFRATMGLLPEPLGGLIRASQPPCLLVFYVVAAVASAAVFAYWLFRRIILRE